MKFSISISIDRELYEKVEDIVAMERLNRSDAIRVLISRGIAYTKLLDAQDKEKSGRIV